MKMLEKTSRDLRPKQDKAGNGQEKYLSKTEGGVPTVNTENRSEEVSQRWAANQRRGMFSSGHERGGGGG